MVNPEITIPPRERYDPDPEEIKLVIERKARRLNTFLAYESNSRKEEYRLRFHLNLDNELRCNISNAATPLGIYTVAVLYEPKPEIDGNTDMYFWVSTSPVVD